MMRFMQSMTPRWLLRLLSPEPLSEILPGDDILQSRKTIRLLAGLLVVMLAWMSWFTVDIASHSQGEVISSGQTRVVQHLEGGIVRRILVREGQRVQAGEALVEVERVASDAEFREIESFLGSLQIRAIRLEAQISGAQRFVVPPELEARFPEQVQTMRALFEAQRGRLSSLLDEQQQRIAQRRAELSELTARRSQLQSRQVLLKEQIRISEQLLADGLANRFEHLNLLKDEETLQGNLNELDATARRVEASLRQEQAALAALGSRGNEDLHRELSETRRQMAELQERLRKYTDAQERLLVRSPIDGIVLTMHIVTEGGVVQPGGSLVSLVPVDEPLLVEARLAVGDIGMVKVGQTARLQLMSSVARGFQPMDGVVTQISPDTMLDEQRVPFFRVRIQPASDAFEGIATRYPLLPGVPVGVAVLTGERSILSYLSSPLTEGMSRMFTEP